MSQNPNSNLPDWITATAAALPVLSIPFVWFARKLSNKIGREEFKEYLKQRDALSEQRHLENLGNFRELFKVSAATREQVAKIEGRLQQ